MVDYVRERSKKPSEDDIGSRFISKASYSIDDMSEDEDANAAAAQSSNLFPRAPQQQPHQQQRQGPAFTQDYFASVLANIRAQTMNQGQQQPSTQSQTVAQPQSSNQQQQQQQQVQQSTPQMSRDFFQNVMSQVFASQSTQAQPQQQTQVTQSQNVTQPSAALSDSDIAVKLEQMHELGLLDDEMNIRALQIAGGNVDAAVSLIMEGTDF